MTKTPFVTALVASVLFTGFAYQPASADSVTTTTYESDPETTVKKTEVTETEVTETEVAPVEETRVEKTKVKTTTSAAPKVSRTTTVKSKTKVKPVRSTSYSAEIKVR